MSEPPSGTVTFLFTDVEGSTRLLERHPDVYRSAIAWHHTILCEAVEQNRGSVFETVLTAAYDAFNARDIERALAAMHPEVDWPNGMEGGYVHGHNGVRDYWVRQWRLIDPHVEPRCFATDDTGHIVVDVHQVVRDRSGNTVTDQMVQHVYVVQDGLIRQMEIRK